MTPRVARADDGQIVAIRCADCKVVFLDSRGRLTYRLLGRLPPEDWL